MTSTRQTGWLFYAALVLCVAGSFMQVLAQNDACGDELIQLSPTNNAYHLHSNNYPSDVTTALHCNWTIQAAPGIRIKLILHDLHIDHYRDNLTVANVPATAGSSVDYILKHFREVKVQVVLSSGHVMRVELTVDLDWPVNSGTTYGRRYWLEFQPVSADASLAEVCSNSTDLYLCASQTVCVNRSGLCDTIMDCPDQSDELSCPHTCPSVEYCSNTSACLLQRFHCDGIQDCSLGEDEMDCDVPVCPNYCTCSEHAASKDGNNLIVNCSSHPDLSDVWLNLPPTTIKLILKRNNITDLEPGRFVAFPHLQQLILEDNKLTELKLGVFNGLRKLQLLKINMNSLNIIDSGVFQTLESLTALRLDDNNITELSDRMFQGLHTLQYLRLGTNRIRHLKANTFRYLTNLASLDLVRNQISSIDPGAFQGLTSLLSLGLRDNLLKVLRANTFAQLKSLTDLSLELNPWTVIEPGAFNGLESLELLSLARKPEDQKDFTVDKHELENMDNLTFIVVDDKRMCCLLSHRVNGIGNGCIKQSNVLDISLEFLTCDRLMHNSVLRIVIWILGISALIGNTFIVIWRLRMTDSGKRSQSVLILNLAVSDLIMGLYMLVIAGADAHFQDAFFLHAEEWRVGHLCNFAGFLSMLSSEASVFFITLISIDRFLCVVFPFGKKWLRLDSARVASFAMWAIALFISIPPLLLQDMIPGFYGLSDVCVGLPMKRANRTFNINKPSFAGKVELERNVSVSESATPSRVFSVTVYLGINLVCCLIVLLCYMAIAFVVIVKLPSKKLHKRKDKENRKKEMAMARRMLLIVGTDFCCWMPVILMGILSMSGVVDIPHETYAWVVVFVIPINSAINPYLYTFSNSNAVSLDCCKCRRAGSSKNSVKMKPLPSNDKDTNQRCRSGTHTFL